MFNSNKAGLLLLSALNVLASSGCANQAAPTPHESLTQEQVLPLTFGGFLKDGPEAEQVQGVCGTDDTRNLLNCDIYNGLPGWTITEVTLVITWSPYEKENVRYYQVPIVIEPRTTEHVTVRLGLQLPPDDILKLPRGKVARSSRWHWQNAGAKGYPAK
jgi:hypothetical protein